MMNAKWLRIWARVDAGPLLLVFTAYAPLALAQRGAVPRIVAIGDIHGNFDAFLAILRARRHHRRERVDGAPGKTTLCRRAISPTVDRRCGRSWIS